MEKKIAEYLRSRITPTAPLDEWNKEDSGSFTMDEWEARLAEVGNCCYYCNSAWNTRDHLTPLVRGGSNRIDNIVSACLSCNARKGSKTLEEFLAWRVNADSKTQPRSAREGITSTI